MKLEQSVQPLRGAFLSQPEADSSSHAEEPGGLIGSARTICANVTLPVKCPFQLNPQGSSVWEELSPRATEEGIAKRRVFVRLLGIIVIFVNLYADRALQGVCD